MISPDRIEAPHANPTQNVPAFVLHHLTAAKNALVFFDRHTLSGKFLDSFARFV